MEDTLTKPQIDILTQQLISSRNELDRLLKLSESSSEIVELDQSKVGRLSRMDAMQQQQMHLKNLKINVIQQVWMII